MTVIGSIIVVYTIQLKYNIRVKARWMLKVVLLVIITIATAEIRKYCLDEIIELSKESPHAEFPTQKLRTSSILEMSVTILNVVYSLIYLSIAFKTGKTSVQKQIQEHKRKSKTEEDLDYFKRRLIQMT